MFSGAAPGRTASLVLGGLHLLNGTAPLTGSDPVVLVPLPAPVESDFPSNTIVLRWDTIGPVDLLSRTVDGSRTGSAKADGTQLFPGMLPGAAVRAAVAEVSGTGGPLVPLFYVTVDGDRAHVYSQIRFLAEDACFIRITPDAVAADVAALGWLADAVRLHAEQFLFLNNHQRYYRKCFSGKELEYKYTLRPPVDSWTLTVELYERLRAGSLPDYVMEYRDEFQAWDYLNHLFEVTGPTEAERGYASFIPTTDGKHLVKRKWYAEDTFERRETHTYGLDLADDGGFERYVREELKVTAVRLPSFRRVRYDVNFESVRTGHVYGIFFDHCSLVDARTVTLNQCELEYLRSRTAIEPNEAEVLAEIAEIAEWLESFLRAHDLNAERGFYSKRTFLKDAVAARPELARTVG
ncbi:hypothetical protein QTQ03_18700 [Micromonospora sp. WMMA1363]|uniref:hypothetical protein n=1 Tax=Micromonospora sp. WMMA1363 TaxID=3053985 RepID=UPI00259CE5D9|nr:hypothetical protein [Micromonospora sp. WMMA1363]MDM4721524.1 hypothetical protein [Micromonospora sp. WMMA1363]